MSFGTYIVYAIVKKVKWVMLPTNNDSGLWNMDTDTQIGRQIKGMQSPEQEGTWRLYT